MYHHHYRQHIGSLSLSCGAVPLYYLGRHSMLCHPKQLHWQPAGCGMPATIPAQGQGQAKA